MANAERPRRSSNGARVWRTAYAEFYGRMLLLMPLAQQGTFTATPYSSCFSSARVANEKALSLTDCVET